MWCVREKPVGVQICLSGNRKQNFIMSYCREEGTFQNKAVLKGICFSDVSLIGIWCGQN